MLPSGRCCWNSGLGGWFFTKKGVPGVQGWESLCSGHLDASCSLTTCHLEEVLNSYLRMEGQQMTSGPPMPIPDWWFIQGLYPVVMQTHLEASRCLLPRERMGKLSPP